PACHSLSNSSRSLTPRHHLRRRSTIHVGLIEYDVRAHVCWPGGQHLLLPVNQIGSVERSQLKSMPVRNRVSRASLHAVPAKDTSIVIDVVDASIALSAADAVFSSVVGGFDVDTVGGAGRCTQKTGYALFQAVFVALQDMGAAEAGFDAGAAQRAF